MKRDVLTVDGMTCAACSNTVEKYVRKQKGVKDASVNLILNTLSVTYDDTLKREDIARFIEEAGYKYEGVFNPNKDLEEDKKDKKLIKIFGILLAVVLYISMTSMTSLPGIHNMMAISIITFIFSVIYIIYGYDILRVGIKSLIIKDPNMDSLVAIGVIANFIYSFINMILKGNVYFESICTIIYFVKLGEYIENIGRSKTRDAIKEMVVMTPFKAHLIKNGKIKEITIDEIKKGDILCAERGERIAVDGVITKGESHIDSSFVTGESRPVKIKKGSKVLASTINLDDYIEYRAENIGPKSTISEIIHMIMDSSNNKTKIEEVSNKYSSIFTKAVLVISIATLILYLVFTHDINLALNHFVSVLVAACPCALGLAAPLALMTSNKLSLKNNILLRDNTPLEIASNIDEAIFDKTGTLTKGKMEISEIKNYSNISRENILEIISSLEHLSSHPIARCFDKYKYLKVKDYKTYNNGIEGYVIGKYKYYVGNKRFIKYYTDEEKDPDASFYLVSNGKIIASIYIEDEVRDESRKVIKMLNSKNIKTVILTGDNKETGEKVKDLLDANYMLAEVMPKDKINYIKEEKKNKKVMMVGDGINDAPSLTEADIGVSLKGSNTIATNSANVILLDDNLNGILKLIKISKKTNKIIKENLIWAFLYNILMIPVACGLTKINLSPELSSLMMVLSSLSVILNTLRLRKE